MAGERVVKVLAKGAEAVLYLVEWLGLRAVKKERIPKKYRHPHLDEYIRRSRTVTEAKLLAEAKKLGVPVPTLYDVYPEKFTLWMEYLEGPRLREYMETLLRAHQYEIVAEIFRKLGRYAAQLHTAGMVHGDLTTSNVILVDTTEPYLIDFGLGSFSRDLEEHGVDVHLMLRSLESVHYSVAETCFKNFMKGYSEVSGEEYARKVLAKVREIRSRARYVEERVRVEE